MDSRVCNVCKVDKKVDEYHRCKNFPLGIVYTCKECARQKSRKWNKENPTKKKEQGRKHYLENKEAYIARAKESGWSKKNRDRVNELARIRWATDEETKGQAKVAKRRAARLSATVEWADKEQIRRIYALCRKITKKTGGSPPCGPYNTTTGRKRMWVACREEPKNNPRKRQSV